MTNRKGQKNQESAHLFLKRGIFRSGHACGLVARNHVADGITQSAIGHQVLARQRLACDLFQHQKPTSELAKGQAANLPCHYTQHLILIM